MSEFPLTDERSVETGLREILEPLDRQLARVTLLLPFAVVTFVPTVFFVLWLFMEVTGKRALVMSGGVFCILVAMYMFWEMLVSRYARRRFDERYPPGSADRAVALRLLTEMETPSKAEEKLRVALACSSTDRIIRRRQSSEQETETGVLHPPSPATGPHELHIRRTAGSYDYIPLEPRQPHGMFHGDIRTLRNEGETAGESPV